MTSVSRRKQKSGAIAAIRERLAGAARPAALRAAGWIAGVLVLASAWALGVPRLEAYASARHAVLAPAARFAAPVPAWAAGPLEADLLAVAVSRVGPDPLRRDDLVAAQQALLDTGWFDEVAQVRRVEPGLVEIEARFAEPLAVALVPGDGRDWLIDVHGRILPRSFDAGASGLTVIVGATFVTDSRGHPVTLEPRDIAAAGALLQRVLPRPWHGQVARIELEHGATDGAVTLRLVTDRGCTIKWGRPPGQEEGREVTADRKIEYLDYHHRQYGHIDRGFLRELDVTGEVVVGR